MTRKRRTSTSGSWRLQDAKARFSELVRRVKSDGPQKVTVHGREEVVVVSSAEYRRLRGQPTGQMLIDLLRGAPLRGVRFGSPGERSPVRDVDL